MRGHTNGKLLDFSALLNKIMIKHKNHLIFTSFISLRNEILILRFK